MIHPTLALLLFNVFIAAWVLKSKYEDPDIVLSNPAPEQLSKIDFYVSDDGNDSWDGSSPTHQSGKVGPWKTIKKSLAEIRKKRPSQPTIDSAATLNVIGTHFLSNTLWLDHRESYLTIKAYDNEPVTVSGGVKLEPANGWTKDGLIKTAHFPNIQKCGELWEGKVRLLPARDPDIESWGFNKNVGDEPYHQITDLLKPTSTCYRDQPFRNRNCPDENRDGFVFNNEFDAGWSDLDQTEVLVYHSWIAEYVKVANISGNKVMFQTPTSHEPLGTHNPESQYRFVIFNNKAVLNKPGESVCLIKNGGVEVSYIPMNDEEEVPIMAQNVVIINISQKGKNPPPQFIEISGLKIHHSSSDGKDGYRWGSESAIRVTNSDDITVRDCEFSNIGMIGLFARNTRRFLADGNVFFDIGLHGVLTMDRPDSRSQDPYEDVMISNNLISGYGVSRYWQPAAIWADGRKNIAVNHNDISNGPNHGIRITGKPEGSTYWSDNGVDPANPTNADFLRHVEFNHVHHWGGILSDYGGIYAGPSAACDDQPEATLKKQCYMYSHIYNNYVHDGTSFNDKPVLIYTDASASKNLVDSNLLVGDAGIWITHHCGLENESRNNIIHKQRSSYSYSWLWGGCQKNLKKRFTDYTNQKNIYLLDSINPDIFQAGRSYDVFNSEVPKFRDNIYWSLKLNVSAMAEAPVFPDNTNWFEWSKVNDFGSRGVNPRFVDPYNGDYSFAPGSPTKSMGIKPITLGKFGIQPDIKQLRYYDSNLV